jgi:hypothetical protein
MSILLKAALAYAELGWRVFPCLPKQKVPATEHGVKDATCDEEQIRRWWKKWPDANIAVACGEVSGIHVVDVDVTADGKVNGLNTIHQLAMSGKIMPKTILQKTPRGGVHYFYKTDNPPYNKNSFMPGVDIRTKGYYVVLTPSIHPNGGEYEWAPGSSPWQREAAEFPDFMRPQPKVIPKSSPSPAGVVEVKPADEETLRRAAAYLATCDPAVQGEGGHDKLLWAASCMVHGFLLSDDQASTLLANGYNPMCDPPWDLSDPKDLRDFERKITEARRCPPKFQPGWLLDSSPTEEVSEEFMQQIHELIEQTKAEWAEAEEAERAESIRAAMSEDRKRLLDATIDQESRDEELRFLTQPPGLLGEICAWINITARKPQPLLALGCVLSFLGALFGRKVADQDDTRTNIYCMGIAPSTAGKNHPPKQIRRLALEASCAGEDGLLGGDDFASAVGIESRLEKNPSTLFLCDEIGFLLGAIKDGQSKHTTLVVPTLMKLYSAADSVYSGREYADTEKRRTLVEPCCCVYGSSTPERFLDALSPEELKDGWLSRCLVFHSEANPRKRRRGEVKKRPVPQEIAEKVNKWFTRQLLPPENPGPDALLTGYASGMTPKPPEPLVVPTLDEAEDAFEAFDDQAVKIAENFPEVGILWHRAEENARRIALIVAAGCNFEKPVIDAEIADYACRLVKYLLAIFCDMTPEITSGNEIEREKVKIPRIVREAGGSCLKSLITRKTQDLLQRKRDAILEDLVESGELIRQLEPSRGGRRAFIYWIPEAYRTHLEQQEKDAA